MADYKQLCVELLDSAEELDDLIEEIRLGDYMLDSFTLQPMRAVLARARAALAEPEPEVPTDEEVDAWADQQGFIRGHGDHPCGFWIDDGDTGALVRAALARWGK